MFKQTLRVAGMLLLCALVGTFFPAYGQASDGSISGTVVDQNGASVTGASVEATNVATGEKRTATTTDNGTYNIPNLSVGVYNVTATGAGFAPSTAQGVQVSVAFNTRQDLTLSPQGASETVVVTSGDAQTQINTTDQQLSTLLDNKKIIDLPLLSRDPNSLLLLAPGVTQTSSGLGGFSVNGQRERNNNFLVDGIDNNDADVPGIPGGAATPNIDATQEFRVITNNFNAEFGRNTGAIVNVATKNGTNDFHGGGYIYYRSDRFAARNFFDDEEKNPLQRKQFGASIGGPIKRDKAFFFFNYEGDRFSRGSIQERTVPSANARLGIFNNTPFGNLNVSGGGANNNSRAGICAGFGLDVTDPGDSAICSAFVTPTNLGLNPAIQQILSLYPLGNVAGQGTIPGTLDLFRFSTTVADKSDAIATRVDWRLTDKHNLTGSFNYNKGLFALFTETFPGSGDASDTPQKTYLLTLNLTSNLTPNLVNELRFGGNRIEAIFNGPGDGGAGREPFDAILAAFNANGVPTNIQPFGGPNGELVNIAGGSITGFNAFDTQFRFTGTTVLGDSITYVKGNHTIRTGFEQRWIYSNGASNFSRSESLSFNTAQFGIPFLLNNSGGDIPTTGAGGSLQNFASLLYGFFGVQSQSQFFNNDGTRVDQDYRGYRVREFGSFFQDTWRVRPNFTLNLGMRWDFNGVPYEVNGQMSTLVDQDPAGSQPVGGFRFDIVGKNSPNEHLKLWENDYNNFGPRFGFNWSPGWENNFLSKLTGGPGNMTVRGGYGVFYDRVFTNLFSNASANPPFQRDFLFFFDFLDFIDRVPTQVTSPFAQNGDELLPVIFALPGNNQFQSKFATPYNQSWNFGFQREVGNSFLFEADYVGSKGTNQLRNISGQLVSVDRRNALCAAAPATPGCGARGDGSGAAPRPISTTARTNFLNGVLNSAFNPAFLNVALGHSSFHSMQLRATKLLTNKSWGTGQIQAVYAWSHSIDDSTDALVPQPGERGLPRDSSGFVGGFAGPERGNSGFDVRHRFVANFIYDLPFNFENKFAKAVFGNWSMSGIWQSQTGVPYTPFGGIDSAGTSVGQRADFAPAGGGLPASPLETSDPRTQTGPSRSLFRNACPANRPNTSASTCGPVPAGALGFAQGRQGNVSRNSFYGPGFHKVDMSLIKRIPVTESARFTIRADFFNIFNHVNFGLPNNDINSALFGQSTTAGAPRIIQFVGRFDF